MSEHEYFGPLDDIRVEESLTPYLHVDQDFEARIKIGNVERGRSIIVAPKGYGKTHFRRFIESKASSGDIFVRFNEDEQAFEIDAGDVVGQPGRAKNVLQLFILTKIAEAVAVDGSASFPTFSKAVNSALGGLKKLSHAKQALKVELGPVSLDLSVLFGSSSVSVTKKKLDDVCKKFSDDLQGKKVYVTIDDLEEVFTNIQDHPKVIESIARAVSDLNGRFKSSAHVLLFLKSGLWMKWSQNRTDYDKVSHEIDFIHWTDYHYMQLVAKRLATFQVPIFSNSIEPKFKEEADLYQVWQRAFSFGARKEWRDQISVMTGLCRSGPRDMIKLCNLAKSRAGDELINRRHVESVLHNFSQEKLADITGEYSTIFPEVKLFITSIIQSDLVILDVNDLKNRIKALSATEAVSEVLNGLHWFKSRTVSEKIKVLYDCGVIGVQLPGKKAMYTMDSPEVSTGEIEQGDLLIHPALRPVLSKSTSY